jgi:hypothetical protein
MKPAHLGQCERWSGGPSRRGRSNLLSGEGLEGRQTAAERRPANTFGRPFVCLWRTIDLAASYVDGHSAFRRTRLH